MRHSSIKAGALALVLGGFAFAGHAFALSPLPLDRAAPLATPVVDEQKAVEQDFLPDQVPAGPQDEQAAKSAPQGGGADKSGGDVEEQELQNMFPSTDWPKK
jgi:hypothetical protein